MIDFVKKPIEFLFDETKSILSKFTYFSLIIFIWILINDISWFSYNYSIWNKIDNILKIEQLKKEYSQEYSMNLDHFKKINELESNIINRESNSYLFYNYIRQITIWEIEVDIWLFISLQWIWIILFIIFLFQIRSTWVWMTLWMLTFLVFIMFIWQFIFDFLSSVLSLAEWKDTIIFNYILNFIVFWIIATIGNNNKKK